MDERCSAGYERSRVAVRSIRTGSSEAVSWNNDAQNVRAAYRNANHREDRNDNLGFRSGPSASAGGKTDARPDRHPVDIGP